MSLSQASIYSGFESPNVVALVPGRAPELAHEHVVITAHLDHVGVGRPDASGDAIYNGAGDNASGAAVLLEVARLLATSPPRRSVIFVAVTAEERGLVGAEWGLSENNRRAKFYALTAAGKRRLATDTATWSRYVEAVARILQET